MEKGDKQYAVRVFKGTEMSEINEDGITVYVGAFCGDYKTGYVRKGEGTESGVDDTQLYEGCFVKRKRIGFGISYVNGYPHYVGEWREGHPCGQGSLLNKGKEGECKGEWNRGYLKRDGVFVDYEGGKVNSVDWAHLPHWVERGGEAPRVPPVSMKPVPGGDREPRPIQPPPSPSRPSVPVNFIVKNRNDFNSIPLMVSELVVNSKCCNESDLTEFNLSRFVNLKSVEVGDECFMSVEKVNVIGLSRLERVIVGKKSFTAKKKGRPKENKNREFHLVDCESVIELVIGCFSFSDYSVCHLRNLNGLKSISIGDRYESYCFYYSDCHLIGDEESSIVRCVNTCV